MASETPYVETEMLLAFLNDDETKQWNLLDGMSANERRELADQCSRMADHLRGWTCRPINWASEAP